MAATEEFAKCIELFDGNWENVITCNEETKQLLNCTTILLNKQNICLKPEEVYLPHLHLKIFNTALNHLCFGRKNFKKIFNEGRNCLDSLQNNLQSLEQCTKQLFDKKTEIISKNEFCKGMKLSTTCMNNIIYETCPENVDINEFFMDLMEENEKFCKTPVKKLPRSIPDEKLYSIRESFKQSCIRNSKNPGAFLKINTALDEFQKCLPGSENFFNSLINDCTTTSDQIIICTKGITIPMRECLAPEEYYLPRFIIDSLNSISDYLCYNDGERFKNLLRTPYGVRCVQELSTTTSTVNCPKLPLSNPNNTWTKNDLCRFLNNEEGCFNRILQRACPNNENFETFSRGFWASIKNPCSAAPLTLCNVLLLIVCFLKTIFTSI